MTYSKEIVVTIDNGTTERHLKILLEAEIETCRHSHGNGGYFEVSHMDMYDQRGNCLTERIGEKYPKTWDECYMECVDHAVGSMERD